MFEVVRADGSTVLPHFHKNGKCDPPEMAAPQNVSSSSGANADRAGLECFCNPAIQYVDIKEKVYPGEKSGPLGVGEAAVALQSLLMDAFGTEAGALNLTDGAAVPRMLP